MANQQSTIKDVAALSGVSIATVDRVLHNRGRVSPEKLKAVLAAIDQLSYRPNQIARALSVRKSNLKIGLTYPKIEDDFGVEIGEGIEAAKNKLLPFGVELIVEHTYDYNFPDQVNSIKSLLNQGVNGLIINPVNDSSSQRIDQSIPNNIPFVTVIEDLIGSRRLLHIGPDDFRIGELAAKLVSLYSNDRCNVVILAPHSTSNGTQQRISGFLSKAKKEIPQMNVLQVCALPGDSEAEYDRNVYEMTLECIQNHSSIDFFYVTNGLTKRCADAVTESEKPIMVFGHEFTKGIREHLESGVVGATIYQKPAQQFYYAINLLFEILIGDRKVTKPVIVTECSIIMKESLPFIKVGMGNLI